MITMSLYKEALKVSPRYRKPNSPPVRRLGQGCLSGSTDKDTFVGPKYTDAHPVKGTHPLTNTDIIEGINKAAEKAAHKWDRQNPIELHGVKFQRPKLSQQDIEYRQLRTRNDHMWALISHTRKLLAS